MRQKTTWTSWLKMGILSASGLTKLAGLPIPYPKWMYGHLLRIASGNTRLKKDYVMWLYIRAKDAHQVAFMVRAFPEIRAVFNHLMICPGEGMFSWDDEGRPHINTPIPPLTRYSMLGLHEYPNICVHLSGQYAFSQEAWPYRDLESWHKTLLSKFGADKLMWATDFPWILEDPGYDKLVQVIDELLPDLNAQQKAEIMGGTAKRVLGFPDVAD